MNKKIIFALCLLFSTMYTTNSPGQSPSVYWGVAYSGQNNIGGIVCYDFSSDSSTNIVQCKRDFPGRNPDLGTLTVGPDSCIYGTLTTGFNNAIEGGLFKFNPNTNEYNLLTDLDNMLSDPVNNTVVDSNLNVYGVSFGSVWKYNKSTKTASTLHVFDISKDEFAEWGLIQGSDGNLYGCYQVDGVSNPGKLFYIDKSNDTFHDLASFSTKIMLPTEDSSGVFFILSKTGGTTNNGCIYRYDKAFNNSSVAYSFNVPFFYAPGAPLIKASNGLLYGTTFGGLNGGSIYEFNPSTSQAILVHGSVIYNSMSVLCEGDSGWLYGQSSNTTSNTSFFKYNLYTQTYTQLQSFNTLLKKELPKSGFIRHYNGSLYGYSRTINYLISCEAGEVFHLEGVADSLKSDFKFEDGFNGEEIKVLNKSDDDKYYFASKGCGVKSNTQDYNYLNRFTPGNANVDTLFSIYSFNSTILQGCNLYDFIFKDSLIYILADSYHNTKGISLLEYDTISKNLIQKFIFDTVATPIVILKTGYDGNLYGYTNNYNTQNEYILKYNPSLNHLDTLFSTSQFSQYGSSIINFELNSNKTLVLISTIKGGLNSRGAVTLYNLTNNTVVYNLPNDSDLFKPNTFYKCYFLNDSTISFYATSDIANSSTSTFITTLTTGSQSFTTPVYIQNYNNYRLIYYSNLLPDGKIYSLFQQFNNNFNILSQIDPITGTEIFLDTIYSNIGYWIQTKIIGSSALTGLNENVNKTEISVYPNPSSSIIKINGTTGNSIINIFSIDGKKIKKVYSTQENTIINIEDLNPGIYIFNFMEKKQIRQGKFIKI